MLPTIWIRVGHKVARASCPRPAGPSAIGRRCPLLSRPGQVWWTVPEGTEEVVTWSVPATMFHEGVPGHHLQLGMTVLNEKLNRFRRVSAELFAEQGYASTTVRNIAERTGLLSGSLYHHFDSKESILEEILAGFLDELVARVSRTEVRALARCSLPATGRSATR